MKEYDYKAIPYKERLTTLCGIALNQYNVIHIDIQQFVSKYPVIKDMVARLTKELLFDVKMEMPDVTLFDETDLVRTSKDIYGKSLSLSLTNGIPFSGYIGIMQLLQRNIWIFCGIF